MQPNQQSLGLEDFRDSPRENGGHEDGKARFQSEDPCCATRGKEQSVFQIRQSFTHVFSKEQFPMSVCVGVSSGTGGSPQPPF